MVEEFKLLGVEGSCDEAPVYVGKDALRVTCSTRTDGSRYVLRQPIKRGRIDHGGQSSEAVMVELQVKHVTASRRLK